MKFSNFIGQYLKQQGIHRATIETALIKFHSSLNYDLYIKVSIISNNATMEILTIALPIVCRYKRNKHLLNIELFFIIKYFLSIRPIMNATIVLASTVKPNELTCKRRSAFQFRKLIQSLAEYHWTTQFCTTTTTPAHKHQIWIPFEGDNLGKHH